MNKPCIVGVGTSVMEVFKSATKVSMDGATGRVWVQEVPTVACPPALLQKVRKTVMEVVKATQIVTTAKEAVGGEAYFVAGELVLNKEALLDELVAMKKNCKLVYLDLISGTKEQKRFINQMGGWEQKEVLDFVEEHKDFITDLVLIGCKSESFGSLELSNDLESVILATEGVLVDASSDKSEALKKVISWKEKEGVKLFSLGATSAGIKSFTSFEKALRDGV
jgi:hypothetical protein